MKKVSEFPKVFVRAKTIGQLRWRLAEERCGNRSHKCNSAAERKECLSCAECSAGRCPRRCHHNLQFSNTVPTNTCRTANPSHLDFPPATCSSHQHMLAFTLYCNFSPSTPWVVGRWNDGRSIFTQGQKKYFARVKKSSTLTKINNKCLLSCVEEQTCKAKW